MLKIAKHEEGGTKQHMCAEEVTWEHRKLTEVHWVTQKHRRQSGVHRVTGEGCRLECTWVT